MASERLITSREAAELLNLRPETLIAWRVRQTPNRPQPVRVGTRSVRYREADVIAFRERETKVREWSGDRKKATRRSK
jgi:predicted DNA-binding transcriptional regulator AlpA